MSGIPHSAPKRLRRFKCLLAALLALLALNACVPLIPPNLPLDPPVYYTYAATAKVDGKTYPVKFAWSLTNTLYSDESRGWYTVWKISDTSVVKILDARYALVFWLPKVYNSKAVTLVSSKLHIAVFDRTHPELLRDYTDLAADENRDVFFKIESMTIRQSPVKSPVQMTPEEQSLKAGIIKRNYGYLDASSYSKGQWSVSPALTGILSAHGGFTPLGLGGSYDYGTPFQKAFCRFNTRYLMDENYQPESYGTALTGDTCSLTTPGVRICRENFEEQKNPVWIEYRGHRFDQQKNEFAYDSDSGKLLLFYREHIDMLDSGEFRVSFK